MAKLQKYDDTTGLEEQGLLANADIPDGEISLSKLDSVPIDEKVKVSSNDTTPGYLNGKLGAGNTSLEFTENFDAGNETLTAVAKTLISSDDTAGDYLYVKVSVEGLTKTELFPGGAEILKLTNEQKVKISADDTSPGYIENKIVGDGELIETETLGGGGAETFKVKMGLFSGLSSPVLSSPMIFVVEQNGIKKKLENDDIFPLVSRGWIREGLAESDSVPVNDTTQKLIDMIALNPTDTNFTKSKRLSWGYGDGTSRCLGLLSGLGSESHNWTEEELTQLHGSFLIVYADDNSTAVLDDQCWFSISDIYVNANGYIGISMFMTSNPGIDHVVAALFQFNYPPGTNDVSLARWVLMDYESARRKLWQGTDMDYTNSSPNHYIVIPNTARMPLDGFYHLIAHIGITCSFTSTPGIVPPYLWTVFWNDIEVYIDDNGVARKIDKTPSASITAARAGTCIEDCYTTLGGEYHIYWINVSAKVYISAADCTNRLFRITIQEPANVDNPPGFSVDSIHWTAEYISKKKAAYCSEFAVL